MVITYNEAIQIVEDDLFPYITKLYDLEGYDIQGIPPHEGGRNIVYCCEKEGEEAKILRIVFLKDRSRSDLMGEMEYVKYLYEHGGSVSSVLISQQGNLLEEITYKDHIYYVCLFSKARGKRLAEQHYQYRDGAPITEYFYNCGKVLGKLHHISKGYSPSDRRFHFSDQFNADVLDEFIPDAFPLLKTKLNQLLNTLEQLDRNRESYGLVHFDYHDGNYSIDYDTGQITVFDFDNSCYCWYMYDLASVWLNGVGWTQFEPDAAKRKIFMDDYFQTVLDGYRSETNLDDAMLEKLPLFIQVNLLENIVEYFKDLKSYPEESEYDEELLYLIRCIEEDIPFKGFFHEVYSCDEPFCLR